MTAVFVLSHQERPPTVGGDPELSAIAGHLVAYGILAVALLYGALGAGLSFRRAAMIAVGLSLVFGVTDELHQRFVPGRHADPWDLVADLAGALVAVGLVALWRHRSESAG